MNEPIGCVNGRMGVVRHTPDVDRSLKLVAREHPDLDHGFGQLRDAIPHILLELILVPGGSS